MPESNVNWFVSRHNPGIRILVVRCSPVVISADVELVDGSRLPILLSDTDNPFGLRFGVVTDLVADPVCITTQV